MNGGARMLLGGRSGWIGGCLDWLVIDSGFLFQLTDRKMVGDFMLDDLRARRVGLEVRSQGLCLHGIGDWFGGQKLIRSGNWSVVGGERAAVVVAVMETAEMSAEEGARGSEEQRRKAEEVGFEGRNRCSLEQESDREKKRLGTKQQRNAVRVGGGSKGGGVGERDGDE